MVSTLCKEVLRLICTYLKDRYISWPGEFEQTIINRAFFDKRGIPGIVGIMDGSHIPIQLLRKIQAADYYCRKGFYSINVQAIIDHNMLFRDIYVGWPGSCPDARVWRNSPFAIKAQREQELPQVERTLFYDNNFIIADAGYGLNHTCEYHSKKSQIYLFQEPCTTLLTGALECLLKMLLHV